MLNTYIVNAQSLINNSNCIIGYAAQNSTALQVMTVSKFCYQNCTKYCLDKFKLFVDESNDVDIIDNMTSFNQEDMMLRNGVLNNNKDRLQSCLSSCYSGVKFDTKIRIPIKTDSNTGQSIDDTGDTPYPWKCDIVSNAETLKDLSCNSQTDELIEDTGSLCEQNELDAAFYSTSDQFNAGDKVSIAITGMTPSDYISNNPIVNIELNTVYLCGFKTLFFTPEYKLGDQYYTGKDKTADIFSPIKNNGKIETGIKVKNGDYLKIQYMGRYNSSCKNNTCKQKDQDYKLDIFVGDQKIDFDVSPYQLDDYNTEAKNNQSQKCNDTCSADESSSICNSLECGSYTQKDNQYGLNVNTFWLTSPALFNKVVETQSVPQVISIYPQFRSTMINGTINNISNTAQELTIGYPSANKNAQGGYFVSVEWKGCKYSDGERLQYTIVNNALTFSNNFARYMISPNGPMWQDLLMTKDINNNSIYSIIDVDSGSFAIPQSEDFDFENDINVTNSLPIKLTYGGSKPYDPSQYNGSIAAPINFAAQESREYDPSKYTGSIYFRIKTLDESEADNLDSFERSRASTSGSYNIKVVNLTEARTFIDTIIEDFIAILKDIPERIFTGFTYSLEYLIIIKLLLIFYIAFTGLSFMIGLAPINQQEAINRVFKIAIVLILLSENSFKFFNQYLFQAFGLSAINFLANTFTPEINIELAPGLDLNTESCFAPGIPIKMLCILEQDLRLFFRWDFWNRIIGLSLSGFFLGSIAIIVGIVLYVMVILKIIIIYCLSLLIATITISLAPIFLPLILFKYTKNFFDSWIKQLISLMLQPVFVFLSTALFRILFLLLIQSLMGNAACQICWIGLFKWCFVTIYVPLSLGSSPSFASLPMSNIGMLLALYFIGHSMYSFAEKGTDMAGRLIKFGLLTLPDSSAVIDNAKKFGSMTYNVVTSPLDLLSMDDKSTDQRKNMRQERRNAQVKRDKK